MCCRTHDCGLHKLCWLCAVGYDRQRQNGSRSDAKAEVKKPCCSSVHWGTEIGSKSKRWPSNLRNSQRTKRFWRLQRFSTLRDCLCPAYQELQPNSNLGPCCRDRLQRSRTASFTAIVKQQPNPVSKSGRVPQSSSITLLGSFEREALSRHCGERCLQGIGDTLALQSNAGILIRIIFEGRRDRHRVPSSNVPKDV